MKALNIILQSLRNNKYVLYVFLLFIFILMSILIIKRVKYILKKRRYLKSGLFKIDMMNGEQFENFLKFNLELRGYKTKLTVYRGDFGADIIATKDNRVTVVQAKRYKKKVGISAVQQIVASKAYYKASESMIITNSYFTKQAKILAKVNDTILWDRKRIIKEFDLMKRA